jgi:hypothetical protein
VHLLKLARLEGGVPALLLSFSRAQLCDTLPGSRRRTAAALRLLRLLLLHARQHALRAVRLALGIVLARGLLRARRRQR